MAYKSILTVVTGPQGIGRLLGVASNLAQAQDAHLDVLAVGVDGLQPAFYGMGDSISAMQIALDQAREVARANEAAARDCLTRESPVLRWSLEGAALQTGGLRDLVAQRARFSDLVVLPQPYGGDSPKDTAIVLESALFDGQSAVLVIPQGMEAPMPTGGRVIIAWNQSREAMAAVRRAMPFLAAARQVSIVVVNPPLHSPERSDPGGQLCQMLVRHGVKAGVSVLAQSEPRTAQVLLRHIREQGADLLVMGAYGHSRLRESILGGATRDMLEQGTVPTLLAH
ncbi:universal stress protein [Fertoebacter nigrum]|uniref:Universal stress protein n=1 Tax=Fertoeibacter niger TaxID=2656921 RepID=A0A8X8GZK3_9RHOB|nr:universal stress protein [Fertoeibacter niger]NUB44321.1 universal stress protein [Fertoeibacter niger]